MSKIKVNEIENRTGSTLTLGKSGTTIQMACGATQTGFGRTGTVNWCTTAKTSPFTATNGSGFFINTTGGAVTVTLPSSPSAGDIVAFSDYASTFACNNLTICRNSSLINGGAFNTIISTSGIAATLVYVDGTRGWKQINDATENISGTPTFINASGGTVTTSGDFKIHTFTGDGTFTINSAPTPANNNISYLVVAGGASGGVSCVAAGGGGAGGFREGKTPATPYTASPLVAPAGLPVSVQAYPVTIGAGGASVSSASNAGNPGSNSIFSTITSAGGGGGGAVTGAAGGSNAAQNGGSGGGAMGNNSPGTGGAGNTPPVSPAQGFRGGNGANPPSYQQTGGGGGATAQGQDKTSTYGPVGGAGGNGGAGATTEITASPVAYAGGGGGSSDSRGGATPAPAGSGGTGGGGAGASYSSDSVAGTANRGGGGGGGNGPSNGGNNDTASGAGGSGVVIIRYKFQ